MTKDTVAKLEIAFSIGANVSEACLIAGISRDTYYNYLRKNPEFSDRSNLLRHTPVLAAKKRIYDAIVNENDTSTAKWLLERKARAEYCNRYKGTPENPTDERLSEEELQVALHNLVEKLSNQ